MSNYPPGVTGNEWQIAGFPDCPTCGLSLGDHGEGYDPDRDIEFYICPVVCPACQGAGDRSVSGLGLIPCDGCDGVGCIPPAQEAPDG